MHRPRLQIILDVAEDLKMIRRPEVFWMTPNALPELEKIVQSAPDPIRMRQQLTGWITLDYKALDGESRSGHARSRDHAREAKPSLVRSVVPERVTCFFLSFSALTL